LLGHADQRVRLGAQLELVKREQWQVLLEAAIDGKAPLLARIHGIWGYGIGLRRGRATAEELAALMADSTDEVVAQTLKVLGDAASAKAMAANIVPLTAHASSRVRFHGAIALGKMQAGGAGAALLKMAAAEAGDPWQRHAVVTGLAGCLSAEELAGRSISNSPSIRLCCTLALARQASPSVRTYLSDVDPAIATEAARAIHDDEGIVAALPELAHMATLRNSVIGLPFLRRAMNANLRLGGPDEAKRLLDLALSSQAGRELQAEALQALVNFTEPPHLDAVDGMHHDLAPRDVAAIAEVIQPRVRELLAMADPQLRATAIQLMVKLSLHADAEALQQIVADARAQAPERVSALRLLAAQHATDPIFTAALTLAAERSAPLDLRLEALTQVFAHQPQQAVSVATRILEKGTLVEKQSALRHLATMNSEQAEALLGAWMKKLVEDKVEPGLKLDVAEAAQTKAALAEVVSAYTKTRTSLLRDDLVEGGSAVAGREIVTNHLGANCLACHTVESKEGSEVGPHLGAVGSQRDRKALLESLLNPTAQIVPGFGLVSISLKDGGNIAGSLAKEDEQTVTVKLADGTRQVVDRVDMVSQTPPMSVMPPMLGILTAREIRDVVAYMASLKAAEPKAKAPKKK
jgi:putative heme-binding domain-containing protein